MLWLHRRQCMNVKWVKIPSLAALQVTKYRTVSWEQWVENNEVMCMSL